jgi:hypothetical protein
MKFLSKDPIYGLASDRVRVTIISGCLTGKLGQIVHVTTSVGCGVIADSMTYNCPTGSYAYRLP